MSSFTGRSLENSVSRKFASRGTSPGCRGDNMHPWGMGECVGHIACIPNISLWVWQVKHEINGAVLLSKKVSEGRGDWQEDSKSWSSMSEVRWSLEKKVKINHKSALTGSLSVHYSRLYCKKRQKRSINSSSAQTEVHGLHHMFNLCLQSRSRLRRGQPCHPVSLTVTSHSAGVYSGLLLCWEFACSPPVQNSSGCFISPVQPWMKRQS